VATKRFQLSVGPGDAGQRLDKFLASGSGLPRGQCRRAIEEGGVWIARRRVRRLSLLVEAGQAIEMVIDEHPPQDLVEPRVLFEDRALLAVDKPAGLPSQGTLASDRRNILGWAQARFGKRVRTVHRLDVGTSGVLLLARSPAAATALAAQFKAGTVAKRYLALCVGSLPAPEGQLAQRIRQSPRRGIFEVTGTGGVPAVTDYRVLAARGALLLVEALPRTGRTHQIRVHLAGAGAPLLGDPRYRGPTSATLEGEVLRASRPLLHAGELALDHPETGKRITLEAPPPEDFTSIARRLRPAPTPLGPPS
jgi:23S rRNA pseudouridine1911/1915/1917 synthase